MARSSAPNPLESTGTNFVVRVHHGGIFEHTVESGTQVHEGHVVGEVKNIEGDTLETVTSPADGKLATGPAESHRAPW